MMNKVSPLVIANRLSALRLEMLSRGIDVYIITSEDNHASEYVGDYFKAREYFSGFSGSAGTLVVTDCESALWTDGRYFLQAAAQLDGTEIELMKVGIDGTPSIEDYICDFVSEGGNIGFNGLTVSCGFTDKLKKALDEKNITFSYDEDLAGLVWEERPRMSAEKIWELNLPSQVSRKEKINALRKELSLKRCDCILISALDQIAWLMNLRGNDIHCSPVFLSYMFVSQSDAKLFVNPSIVSDDILRSLNADGIELLPYDNVSDFISSACEGKNVWADKTTTSYALMRKLDSAHSVETSICPIEIMKAVKSPAEQAGIRDAHLRDGVALTKFICWLKTNIRKISISELSAAEKLLSYRQQQEKFFDISFDTIVGYGKHAAIVHYSATEESNTTMKPESFCLVDSGAQYYDGTTDVTRTISLGNLTAEQKKHYTLVLKGHLALGNAVFKDGTSGAELDKLAREPLLNEGLNYLHGTGHGVGCVLNVHEGPQRISTVFSSYPFSSGMITSNEPGLYLEEQYGIRIENLTLSKKNPGSDDLIFETLTLAPYDRDSIDVSLLTDIEKQQINDYHARVFDSLSPYLSDDERQWLLKETKPF